MADLLQRFSGNPFSTPVGQRIEQATDPSMTSENWALNMEICDIINDTEDGARDAVRAIKRRLQQTAGKNFTAFKLTLTVLETCVKNCGKRFHILVTNKDFVQDLVKLIGPKNDPPAEIQEKVLNLIQSWAEAFHGQPEMQGVTIVYNELRNKGIEFSKTSTEPKVPIYTPSPPKMNFQHQQSPPTQSTPPGSSSPNPLSATAAALPVTNQMRSTQNEIQPIHLTPEQLNKLKTDLEIVQGNMKVLSEMLTELKPGQEHKDDWDLLIELHRTLTMMQKRIVDLIEKIANEEVTSELLRINDDLNNLFMRFDRYQKKRNPGEQQQSVLDGNIPSTSSSMMMQHQAQPVSQTNNKNIAPLPSLIDFTDETDNNTDQLSKDFKELQLNSTAATQISNPILPQQSQPVIETMGDKEFDMFAQSRSSSLAANTMSSATTSIAAINNPIKLTDPQRPKDTGLIPGATPATTTTNTAAPVAGIDQEQEKDMEEIERWLNTKPGEPSISFETFLERRASALDKQPLKNKNSQDSSLI